MARPARNCASACWRQPRRRRYTTRSPGCSGFVATPSTYLSIVAASRPRSTRKAARCSSASARPLFNLRVAVRAHGRESRVRLMPDPAEPDLAATGVDRTSTDAPAAVRALADAIPRRHTNRRPFADRPVPFGTMEELAGAATAEGAALLTVDPALRAGVLSLTRTAENRMRADPRYRAELAAWTTPGGVGRRDGVPRQAFGPRDRQEALPLRDFALGHGAPRATIAFEPDPTLILCSPPVTLRPTGCVPVPHCSGYS